jgi:hypothetical protein
MIERAPSGALFPFMAIALFFQGFLKIDTRRQALYNRSSGFRYFNVLVPVVAICRILNSLELLAK